MISAVALMLMAPQVAPVTAVASMNNTGFKMLGQAAEVAENVVLSPLSIQLSLTACYMGSAGEARTGLATALDLPAQSNKEIAEEYGKLLQTQRGQGRSVGIANAMWLPAPPQPELQQLLSLGFETRPMKLPESEATIVGAVNDWAAAATQGRIKRLLDRPQRGTKFVVASACTFDAEWPSKLLLGTGDAGMEFHVTPAAAVRVDSLSSKAGASHVATSTYEAVVLAYKGHRYGLLLVEPRSDRTLEALLPETGAEWLSTLRKEAKSKQVELTFPKFTIGTTLAIPGFLKNMGAQAALVPGDRFPGFGPNVHLQDVLHASKIEVDELGTRAAAATALRGAGSIGQPEKVTFVVDRPFLYGVLDQETGLLVFCGICRRP